MEMLRPCCRLVAALNQQGAGPPPQILAAMPRFSPQKHVVTCSAPPLMPTYRRCRRQPVQRPAPRAHRVPPRRSFAAGQPHAQEQQLMTMCKAWHIAVGRTDWSHCTPLRRLPPIQDPTTTKPKIHSTPSSICFRSPFCKLHPCLLNMLPPSIALHSRATATCATLMICPSPCKLLGRHQALTRHPAPDIYQAPSLNKSQPAGDSLKQLLATRYKSVSSHDSRRRSVLTARASPPCARQSARG